MGCEEEKREYESERERNVIKNFHSKLQNQAFQSLIFSSSFIKLLNTKRYGCFTNVYKNMTCSYNNSSRVDLY